jgi:hypothetical protein
MTHKLRNVAIGWLALLHEFRRSVFRDSVRIPATLTRDLFLYFIGLQKNSGVYLKLGHNRVLQHPSKFSRHTLIGRYVI